MTTYKDSGVDVELGNTASEIFYNAIKRTWENRKGLIGEVLELGEGFSTVRGSNISSLPSDVIMGSNSDGIGTKVEIAERINNHRTIAYDLIAMVCDDAVRFGAEPIHVTSVFDVNSLKGNIEQIRQLAEGYMGAAKKAGIAVINGETAELGKRVGGYGKFNYNWGATAIWVAKKDNLITGLYVSPGDSLVAFKERGFRSNGISLVRRIMEENFGDEWHNKKFEDEKTFGDVVLTPSEIYTRTILNHIEGYSGNKSTEIKGIAHITGGGIPEKLGRVLKQSGFGAHILPLEPNNLMKYLQNIGQVKDEEAYKSWNMGQGMIVVTPKPEELLHTAKRNGIEADIIGVITHNPGIMIESKGYFSKGKELYFE